MTNLNKIFAYRVLATSTILILLIGLTIPVYAFTLTQVTTGFNGIIGIDHHEPTNKMIVSVNYPTGKPYNFELVAADGSRTQFSSINGLTDEVKIATVRSGPCQGGFIPGEMFTGTGVAGKIARISPDGSSAQIPWVTLSGETGLMRGSLFQDRFCVFGGDLIVVTTSGKVWRVTSAGTATQLASLGTHLEGVTTVPNNPAKYGPWAGKILAGAEGQGRIYTIDPLGITAFYTLGINPEDIDIIPANENFFGVDFGGQRIMGASPSQFTGIVGDILIAQEFPGILWHVRWDGSNFQKTELARVSQWEHVTFTTAGIVEIPPVVPLTITAPSDVTVNTDAGACSATVSLETATTSGGVAPVSITNNAPSGFIFPKGTTTVTWTATDAAGNTATDTQAVTVVDNETPSITAPPDIIVTANTAGGYTGPIGTATASDNCPGVTVSGARSDGQLLTAEYPIGTTTITWTATDASSNTNTATQLVTVNSETVSIDIKPGSFPNAINTNNQGVIPVAILTTGSFDASTVDAITVTFGPNNAPALRSEIEDVDGDGDLDMILHFDTQQTGIACGQTSATLKAETLDGIPIEGTDSIKTVAC